MLVLTRKIGERIVIGQNITMTIARIRGSRVTVSFEGPSDVPIHREEIYQRLTAEAARATAVSCPG